MDSPVPPTAARRWSATGRTSGPPPSPSSPSPSTISLPPSPHSPSLCCLCSRATSLGCRPAPALVLTLGVRLGRTVKMQLKMCTDTRALWLQQPLLQAQFDLHLLEATPQFGSRGRPAPGPAPHAPRALSRHTAFPAHFQLALAPCTRRQRESREGVQCCYRLHLHLRPWGQREGRCHQCCRQCKDTVSIVEVWPVYQHSTVTH